LEQAGGTKTGQRAGGKRRAALRTFVSVGHGLIHFYRVHAHFRSKTGKMLPENVETTKYTNHAKTLEDDALGFHLVFFSCGSCISWLKITAA
jgi:hypothetical protein